MTSRFMKIMGLCLVAAFVMSAVAVATASASTPGFIFSGTNKAFSSKSGEGKLVAKSGENGELEVKCTSDKDRGEVSGASGTDKVTNVVVTFNGCTLKVLLESYACSNAGKEEIITNTLEGELGYVKGTLKVGLVLLPKESSAGFAEFKCVHSTKTVTVKVTGEVIGEIPSTSLNVLIDPPGHFSLLYEHLTKNYEQQYQELEVLGSLLTKLTLSTETSLEPGKLLQSAITTKDEIFPLESMEISG